MRDELLDILVDPIDRSALTLLHPERSSDGSIVSATLASASGAAYTVRDGIPRFVLTQDPAQLQTAEAFHFKWQRRPSYEDPRQRAAFGAWLVEKYGYASLAEWARDLDAHERVLDLGCGSAHTAAEVLARPEWTGRAMYVGVDISLSVEIAAERGRAFANTHFAQADVMSLPFRDGAFDAIVAEGVLHHTPSTRRALLAAARALAPGGRLAFYVYRRKGPIREFADDHIRAAIADMTNEEAWEVMRTFTAFAQALSSAHAEVDVPDVPLLGIKGGRYDVQRLVYWSFLKLFWNDEYPFEGNVHVNFDWYRPAYAHRQTADEVRAWCDEASLRLERFHEENAGFAVVAVKAAR